jgi:coenzyme F420-0:L-glutamate ligase/coenzyme F420-1:gamma-L-glutamate ligase
VLSVEPLPGLPEVRPGDDLAALLIAAAERIGGLADGDVVAIAHKVVSKAEGRVARLEDVEPGPRALAMAAEHGKDPRHLQVVLDESVEVVRADRGRIICQTRHGFVCANAGVDASNAGAEDALVMLPLDPDGSARRMRVALQERFGAVVAVVVTDSFGRAWRQGQAEIAIGCAGLAALDDWRGRADGGGRSLNVTIIAVADEVAGAADLVRSKDSREPAIRIRGLGRHVSEDDGPGAVATLVRDRADDMFR